MRLSAEWNEKLQSPEGVQQYFNQLQIENRTTGEIEVEFQDCCGGHDTLDRAEACWIAQTAGGEELSNLQKLDPNKRYVQRMVHCQFRRVIDGTTETTTMVQKIIKGPHVFGGEKSQ